MPLPILSQFDDLIGVTVDGVVAGGLCCVCFSGFLRHGWNFDFCQKHCLFLYFAHLRVYQLPKRKSRKTGLLTPPKETAAAWAVRLVPRLGYCKQGQVRSTLLWTAMYGKQCLGLTWKVQELKKLAVSI
jgi:hypothetical protein